jgi:hypothetical protein
MEIYQGELFLQAFDELGDDWFLLLLENDPLVHHLPAGSDTLLNGVRSLATTWRSLGLQAGDTMAYVWSKPRKVSLTMDIVDRHPFPSGESDRHVGQGLASLRMDYVGTSVRAAWGDSERCDEEEMPEPCQDEIVFPIEPSHPAQGIDEAIDWLLTQARRPIHRLEWTRNGETIARLWRLADTGRELARSGGGVVWSAPPAPGWEGPPELQDLHTATSILRVHP